jgi:hypothetical protein
MRSIPLLIALAAASACSSAPPVGRTAEAQAHLNRMLAGRVPGRPVSCLPSYGRNDMITIDQNTILFRSGGTVYRNEMRGGCANYRDHYTLVTRTTGIGPCSGDIAEIADLSTGTTVGSCVFGDFVPYTMPRG